MKHRRTHAPDGTLTDTGPLFALVDAKGQPEQFERCSLLLPTLPTPMVTTWPCVAEVMHLAGREGGWAMRKLIVKYISADFLRIHTPTSEETARIFALMEQYADVPMDLADASLVALAEVGGYTRIFSIDSDFYVYRLADGSALEVLPGPLTKAKG